MNISTSTNLSGKSFLCFGLILIAIGISRYIPIDHPSLFNFSPTLAIFLVAGAYLKGKYAFIFPIFAIIFTDLILNSNYGVNLLEPFMIITIGSYFLIFFFGKNLGNQCSISKILGAGIASAITFHIITCSFSWLANPAYIKSFYGWIQCLFIGEAGYAPSYLFLRNSVLSTALFSVLFAYAAKYISSKQQMKQMLVRNKEILEAN
tara:strand:+ start:91 stop:708 length:618 start_codon:yes stop_codon:yes gene_type:complete